MTSDLVIESIPATRFSLRGRQTPIDEGRGQSERAPVPMRGNNHRPYRTVDLHVNIEEAGRAVSASATPETRFCHSRRSC